MIECISPAEHWLRTGGRAGRAATLAAGLMTSIAAQSGIVLREVQLTEPQTPAPGVRLVRQVLSEGDDLKIIHEESTDTLAPAGSYVLANAHDAFFVDPTRATVAPVDPTSMVLAVEEGEPPSSTVSGVRLERELEEPGPMLLGLATRHYVYRLLYDVVRDGDAGAPLVLRHEERHEFHAAPWSASLAPPRTWRAWRVAEDAGVGNERREVREAIDALHEHGLMLRHSIERRVATAEAQPAPVERVSREITALNVQEIDARVFIRPEGFAPAEFLAPVPDDGNEAVPVDPGGAPAPGGAQPGG